MKGGAMMTTHGPGTTTLTQESGIWVLTLTGEHDLTTAPMLDQDMERIARSGTSVVIDLTLATFIDSQVIAWLLRWSERSSQSTHLHLAIATGSDGSPAARLFELVRLTDALPCYPTTAEALHHLNSTNDTL